MLPFNNLKLSLSLFVTFALNHPLKKSMTATFGFLYLLMFSNNSDSCIDNVGNLLPCYGTVLDIDGTV